MPVQMIELEEVIMMNVSDDAMEATVSLNVGGASVYASLCGPSGMC